MLSIFSKVKYSNTSTSRADKLASLKKEARKGQHPCFHLVYRVYVFIDRDRERGREGEREKVGGKVHKSVITY